MEKNFNVAVGPGDSVELFIEDTRKSGRGACDPALVEALDGIAIDARCRVLRADGSAIPGLFAAGEVTGGVHGRNRIGGNAGTEVLVFGRIAGREAALDSVR